MSTSADRAVSPEKVADAGDSPTAPAGHIYDWCHAGGHYSRDSIPCHHIEAGSGPGYSVNACPEHMREKGWKPMLPVHAPTTT